MMLVSTDDLAARAKGIMDGLAGLDASMELGAAQGQIGGGSLPRTTLPSVSIQLRPHAFAAAQLAERLRRGPPPVVGHIERDAVILDLRTVLPSQDQALQTAIRAAFATGPAHA